MTTFCYLNLMTKLSTSRVLADLLFAMNDVQLLTHSISELSDFSLKEFTDFVLAIDARYHSKH